ncbi:MAG: hypothetical protein Q8N26_09075 [Myxococcales bacterium]|nr:hypothetical protein [Myxococcales bacterium]
MIPFAMLLPVLLVAGEPEPLGLEPVTAGPRVTAAQRKLVEQSLEQALRALPHVAIASHDEVKDSLAAARSRELMGMSGPSSAGPVMTSVVRASVSVSNGTFHVEARRLRVGTDEVLARAVVDVKASALGQVGPTLASSLAPAPLPRKELPVVTAELTPKPIDTAPAPVPAAERPVRVALLDVRATGEVPSRALVALDQSLPAELRKLERVSVISAAELRDLLSMERQKQLVGCSEDTACMMEIAAALDADELVSVDLVLVGQRYALSSRRFDLRAGRVRQTYLEQFEARDGEELLAIVGPLATTLYPERPLRAGRTRGVDPSVIRRLNPPPLSPWVFGITTAAAVAAAGVGLGVTVGRLDTFTQYRALLDTSVTTPVPGTSLTQLEARAQTQQTLSTALFIGAGVLATAAVVQIFFTDWRGDRGALQLSVGISPSLTSLAVGGRL